MHRHAPPTPCVPGGRRPHCSRQPKSPIRGIHGTDVEGRRAAGCPRRPHQGQRPDQVRQGRARGVAHGAGDRRFLGAVVRAVQDAAADDREGRQGGQGRGQAGQDQHRPEPDAGPAAAHPVDPGGLRLLRRPPGRRLHGRGARKPDQGVRRPAGAGRRRRAGATAPTISRGAGARQGRRWRRSDFALAAQIYNEVLRGRAGQPRRRWPAWRAAMPQDGDAEQARAVLGQVAGQGQEQRRDRRRRWPSSTSPSRPRPPARSPS